MTSPKVARQSFHWRSFSSSVRGNGGTGSSPRSANLRNSPCTSRTFPIAPGIEHLLCLHVHAPIALLKAECDVLLAVGPVRDSHHTLASGYIEAGGFLHVNVLAGFHRRFKMLWVKIHGRRNYDGVHVACQNVLVVLVCFGVRSGYLCLCILDLLIHDIADGGNSRSCLFGDQARCVGAAASGPDKSDPDGTVLRRASNGLNRNESRRLNQRASGGM